MATQPETVKIARPFKDILRAKGWMVSNINPNASTDSLPDCVANHPTIGERWIEFKIIYGNGIKCTPTQKERFPQLMSFGMRIYCIAAHDLRGEENFHLRQRMYKKLFEEPNGKYMCVSSMQHLLF